jgi:hypothetical protein
MKKSELIKNATEIYKSMLAAALQIPVTEIELDLTCNNLNDLMVNELKAEGLEFKKYPSIQQLHTTIEEDKTLIRLNGKDKTFFKIVVAIVEPYYQKDALEDQRREDKLFNQANNI